MQDYIDRLVACRVRIDDATVIVNDFLREQDWDGLAEYVAELERLHGLAEVSQ